VRISLPFLMSCPVGAAAGMGASLPKARKTVFQAWTNASHVTTGIAPRPLDPQGGSTG